MNIKELQQIIIENFYDAETNTIEISGMNFKNKNINISKIKARDIYQQNHKAKEIAQYKHVADEVRQYKHIAGRIAQYEHISEEVDQWGNKTKHSKLDTLDQAH